MCAGTAIAGQQPNQLTGFTGLGEGGYALISKGLHTSDGSGALDLFTGADPAANGTVSFLLNTVLPGYLQPCVFNYALGTSQPGPDPSYWPQSSQIGWFNSNATTGEATMYWRAAELAANGHYVVLFICPPRVRNFNGGK
jgi:hypothetical protein